MAGFNNDVVFAQQGMRIGDITISTSELASIQFEEAGSDVTLLVNNTSDTPSSDSGIKLEVAGPAGGSPTLVYSVDGQQSFVQGISNQSSDYFVMAQGSDITSTSNQIYRIQPSTRNIIFGDGLTPLTNAYITMQREFNSGSFGATALQVQINNTSVTTGGVVLVLSKPTAATGDVYIQLQDDFGGGGNPWSFGNDTSNSNTFTIARDGGSDPFSQNICQRITTAGEVTFPLTPAFLATGGLQSNVTGDGTTYTVTFAAGERFDQNNDFDGTSTFTAPVTGKYRFTAHIAFISVGTTTSGQTNIITSNKGYRGFVSSFDPIGDSTTDAVFCGANVLCDMDASDIATVTVTCIGGAKTVDIASNSAGTIEQTFFCGELVC